MPKPIATLAAAVVITAAFSLPTAARAADTDLSCHMSFTMKGWSVIYKTASGSGTVTCSNGQTAKVHLKTTGGGLVAGKTTIDDGKGNFTGVKDISNIYGDYALAQGEAGAVKTAEGTVLSKGEVSLALSGNGRGFDLGVSFGKFTITPIKTVGTAAGATHG